MYNNDMLQPRNIVSLVPSKYLLEDINNKCNKIHVYVDFKNILRSLYVSDISEQLTASHNSGGSVSSLIFQSILFLFSDWKEQCDRYNIELDMYVFSDVMPSNYHTSIDTGYKSSRKIGKSTSTLSEDVLEVRQKNTELGYSIYNKLPNMYMFYLRSLESDFIPYWLITRKFKEDTDTFHVILSNDKDMFQILKYPNTCQIYKMGGTLHELSGITAFFRYYGLNKETDVFKYNKLGDTVKNMDKGYLLASMAMSGDVADDVPGIPGVKERTSLHLLSDNELNLYLLGSPDELEDRVSSGGNFFKDNINWSVDKVGSKWHKLINKVGSDKIDDICTKSYRLISFECLCRWLEEKDTTNKINTLRNMNSILDKLDVKPIPDSKVFFSSIKSLKDCFLTEYESDVIFR